MTSIGVGGSRDPVVVVGVVAWSAVAAWAAARAAHAPVAAAATTLAVGGAVVVARSLARRYPWTFPAVAAAAGTAVLLVPDRPLLDGLRGPLGYGNASAAAAVLVGAIAWVAAARAPAPARWIGWVVGAGLLAVPVWTGARAATLSSLAVVAGLVGATTRRRHRMRLLLLLVAWLAVVVATTGLAAAHDRSEGTAPPARAAAAAVSERRLDLWADALELWQQEPVVGIGLGQFVQRSHTARGDRDAARAHHEYLQATAETGLVGVLAASAAIAPLVILMWRTMPDRGTAVAVMALGGLFVQAAVDHVLHFAVVVAGAVILVGIAMADAPGRSAAAGRHRGAFRRRVDGLS